MRRAIRNSVLLPALLLAAAGAALSQSDAETRVLNYISAHLQPGKPLMVTQLYNQVFTQPDERKALNKLYNAFFRIPLFVAQYQQRFQHPPTLRVIAQQFDLHNAQAAEVLLRVMQSDPRVPRFLTQNPTTHEITHVDVEAIRNDPRFGQALARQLGGWKGEPAPAFTLARLGGGEIGQSSLRGKTYLLYVWFTGCPPCMAEAPNLVALQREFSARGFTIVGANADQFLGLDYDDSVRQRYIASMKINFPVATWNKESNSAYGGITIFPTLFLVDSNGVIRDHWVGYVKPEALRAAVVQGLAGSAASQGM